jgi:spore germination protein YaaH
VAAPRRPHPSRPASAFRTGLASLLAAAVLFSGCVTITRTGASDGPSDTSPSLLVASAATSAPASPDASPGLATEAPRPTASPSPTPTPVDAEVFGFLPYWLLDVASASIQPELLSTVAWFGVEAAADGRLVRRASGAVPPGWLGMESQAFADLKSRLQGQGVRVVLTIQRFGWNEGGARRTRNLLRDADARSRLARQIASIVSERGFDGVNLDFEPMPEELSGRYVDLVREVRAALDGVREGLHLSVDVVNSLTGYDLAALTADDAADLAIIMGYEYRGAGAPETGSHAPLVDASGRDISTSVREAIAQAPADRLLLALPWYGRAWSAESADAGAPTVRGERIGEPSTVGYALAVEQALISGRDLESTQASAWSAFPFRSCATCPETWRQVWYDDPDGYGAKVDHALAQGLAGVGIWAIGFEADRPELWWALQARLRPRDDVAPPNGSASLDPATVGGDREGLPLATGSATILAFAADEQGGSGLGFVRAGLDPEVGPDGALVLGRTFPATTRIVLPLGDPAIGGSPEPGPRSIHVQWRDLAGNWSAPMVIGAWAASPAPAPVPAS